MCLSACVVARGSKAWAAWPVHAMRMPGGTCAFFRHICAFLHCGSGKHSLVPAARMAMAGILDGSELTAWGICTWVDRHMAAYLGLLPPSDAGAAFCCKYSCYYPHDYRLLHTSHGRRTSRHAGINSQFLEIARIAALHGNGFLIPAPCRRFKPVWPQSRFCLGRHCIWLSPFIILPLGTGMAALAGRLQNHLPHAALAALILALGFLSYMQSATLSNKNEYFITKEQAQEVNRYIAALPSSSLIVSGSAEAFLLYPGGNLYEHYPLPEWGDAKLFTAKSIPPVTLGSGVKMLFWPFSTYPQGFSGVVQQAEKNGDIKDIDRLVFVTTLWSRYREDHLFFCPQLNKQIILFPALQHQQQLTPKLFQSSAAALLVISKYDFFNQLISPAGKAHACMANMPARFQ